MSQLFSGKDSVIDVIIRFLSLLRGTSGLVGDTPQRGCGANTLGHSPMALSEDR